MKLDNAY